MTRIDPHSRLLVLVWAALLVLLAATVGASFLPIGGSGRTAISLSIALAKAALIFWFYMHLREEGGLVRLAAAAGALWLLIMLALMSADYLTRGAS